MSDHAQTIERINQLTRAARGGWLSLLTFTAFVGVTLIGVKDADFFVPGRQTDLPLIGVSIPTYLFFVLAPLLTAALYANLHFHLMKLWDALAPNRAPAFATGKELSEAIAASFIADMALAFRRDKALRARPMRGITAALTLVLVFAAVPVVLGFVWWFSWPAHNELLTLIGCGVPLLFTWTVGFVSFRHMRRMMIGGTVNGLTHSLWAQTLFVLIAAAVGWWGFIKTENTVDHYERVLAGYSGLREGQSSRCSDEPDQCVENKDDFDETLKARSWSGVIYTNKKGKSLLYPTDLQDVDLVGLPEDWLDYQSAREAYRRDWCKSRAVPLPICGAKPDAGEEPSDLGKEVLASRRAAWCQRAMDKESPKHCAQIFADQAADFTQDWETQRRLQVQALPDTDLRRRDLRNANLSSARMEGADLSFARMEGADLSAARMEGANLREARMERAILSRARMERAILSSARMEEAILSNARMVGANLWGARMEGANLTLARMEGADLSGARMEGADLTAARMEGAILFGARMERAILTLARMEGAILVTAKFSEDTDFTGAAVQYAAMKWGNYERVNLSQDQVNAMFGDRSVILPAGMKFEGPHYFDVTGYPAHWLDTDANYITEFLPAWRAWQKAQGYAP
ncbi:Pentapeptide repeat family protein [Candidatus Rhodobacter oscarellae]|uniref:Pentapeptide repeat family protein n=1 Tax=Candidatus Rhodobacter oscarellae TaxID=1675527 RepID=A0A0J9E0P2_9RHOB|nr:pentapeptide repeat-containing protein [Candidatus Rhodobacter lobularis]KMW56222.1 Pentapeptide repeat family protein [Candidatus Rhodobacter lobularis]